ncbi:MAG: hypothetical protein HYT48_00385 [Candidatus Vogelbacteria bacterium]|nr:hypothetical protein [Candidatus Vogelbacteria bacterium]
MAEAKKAKMGWLGGGVAIGLAAMVDLVKLLLYFILIGFVVNWIISFMFLLAFAIWLTLKHAMTLPRGITLLGAVVYSLVPFAMTGTVAGMVARIIAGDKLAVAIPGGKAAPKPSRLRFGHVSYEG